jgi:hypothetical protein
MSNQRDRERQPVCRTTTGYPCVDGPLVGEFHDQGESFEFEGSWIGSKDGTYRLVGGSYLWQAAVKAGLAYPSVHRLTPCWREVKIFLRWDWPPLTWFRN